MFLPFLLLTLPAAASSPSDFLQLGNEAYEAADYGRALALYDSAAAGARSADIYFNRGNAWFKLGETGRAIADYRRAQVLDPHDQDIRHNLEFARAYRADKLDILPNPVVKFLAGLLRVLSLAQAKLLFGLLFLLAMAALLWFLVRRSRTGLWFAVALGALCLYVLVSWLSWAGEVGPDRAVVVASELTLRSGPGEDYKDILIVHDGLEVRTLSRRGRYVLVQAPGGEGGWADSTTVVRIFD